MTTHAYTRAHAHTVHRSLNVGGVCRLCWVQTLRSQRLLCIHADHHPATIRQRRCDAPRIQFDSMQCNATLRTSPASKVGRVRRGAHTAVAWSQRLGQRVGLDTNFGIVRVLLIRPKGIADNRRDYPATHSTTKIARPIVAGAARPRQSQRSVQNQPTNQTKAVVSVHTCFSASSQHQSHSSCLSILPACLPA